jgi:hypothetical protein
LDSGVSIDAKEGHGANDVGWCVALLSGGVLLDAALVPPAHGGRVGPEVTKGGTLRIASPVEPDYFDPALAYTSRAWTLE